MNRELRREIFVYCLAKMDDGTYELRNRAYLPIGRAKLKIPKSCLDKIAVNRQLGTNPFLYLYNDSCLPDSSEKNLKEYYRRLSILLKVSTSCPVEL